MMILDLNQVMISNLMMSLRGHKVVIDENILRHMILNTIRFNLVKFKQDYGPELIIACDDTNNWRKSYYPYYKANRKKSRDMSDLDWNNIFQSLNKIREEIRENFPYRMIQVERAEADDIIGTLCFEFGRPLGGDPILILSGDKDFMQLQKYANVSQYDPVRKRFLKCSNPDKFLIEHILKGDSGDGVPNFLSSDDTFVSNSRQHPLRKKTIDEILSADWPEEWTGMNEQLLRNFKRNSMMIDLSNVPENIQQQVREQYEQQANKGRAKLFNYFIANKLRNLTEKIGEF